MPGCVQSRSTIAFQACQAPEARRYGYYFLSSMGVRVSQGVKKSITVIQLIQVRLRLLSTLQLVHNADMDYAGIHGSIGAGLVQATTA